MSSKKSKNSENFLFRERFIEVCGSSQPAEIARLLKISYQAAKNYLQGRLPDAKVLITIAEKTSYSLNWLLTGEGEKYTKNPLNQDTLLLADQMRTMIRKVCVEVIGETLSAQNDTAQQKIVVLPSESIKKEKLLGKLVVLSENDEQ